MIFNKIPSLSYAVFPAGGRENRGFIYSPNDLLNISIKNNAQFGLINFRGDHYG